MSCEEGKLNASKFHSINFSFIILKGYYEFKARPRPNEHAVFFPPFITSDERIQFTVTFTTRLNNQDERVFYTVESYELKEFKD
jgi:hypothetical protein